MGNYTRAQFLQLSAILAGAGPLLNRLAARNPSGPTLRGPSGPTSGDQAAQNPGGPTAAVKGAGIEADLIVTNAVVYTIDPATPRAEAFAVKDGRFLAVGSTADVRNLAGPRTQAIDAQRLTVVPGFIDTHCHPSGVNELFEVNANVRTMAELQANLRARAAKTPAGFWVSGHMFDDTKLDRPLTRQDLDAVSTAHPIVVNHRGGHTSWYNSLALQLADITPTTPDPEHGRFFRDANGQLTGRAAEQARGVFGRVGRRQQFTPEEQRERARQGMRHISELLTAAGLTTVHDAGAGADRIRTYEDVYRGGHLRHRAYLMVRGAYEQLRNAGIYTGFGDEWVRIGGVKYGADGSASERTMRMSTPYVGTSDYGILTMTQDDIQQRVEEAHRNNWQVGIHANGDVTIDMVLNAYERVLKQWPHPDRRHRIEHCSLVNPSLLARIKATGTVPTPFWTYVYYHGEKWAEYGDDKMRWMFAHRSFLDSGITVPGASDYGPGPFEPLMAIQSMVTRRDYRGREWGPNQKVTVDEALKIATINGAYASYEENVKGSITAGKLADFVMLEGDPHTVAPDEIMKIKVARTVVGGKTMFPRT
jgi:predicted amidohydrolase YtcJ